LSLVDAYVSIALSGLKPFHPLAGEDGAPSPPLRALQPVGLLAEMIQMAAAPPARAAQEALDASSLRAQYAWRLHEEKLCRAHEDGVVVEVDWHNFAVVEMVRFSADEGAPDEPFLTAWPAELARGDRGVACDDSIAAAGGAPIASTGRQHRR